MAIIQRYVNMGSSAGGDGTTNGTAGATRAYATSAEAEANEAAAFNGDNLVVTCDRGSGGDDTTQLQINGSTFNSSADYLTWKPAIGMEAVKTSMDAARYFLHVSGAIALYMQDDFIRIDGLQIQSDDFGVRMDSAAAGSDMRITSCRVNYDGVGSHVGIRLRDPDLTAYVVNTIITNFADQGYYSESAGITYIYNSIVYGTTGDGIRGDSGSTITAVNTASFNNGDDWDFRGTSTVTTCMSDDALSGSTGPSGGDWLNEYVNAAAGDFTLVAAGNAEGGGTDDPGSGIYSVGMDGRAYTSPWSIGVDAKAGAPGGNAPTADLQGCLIGPLGGPLMNFIGGIYG